MEISERRQSFIESCNHEISVGDLLANSDLLGLPAFQRGQVWDGAAAEGLLRSLSKGYFVGTLLLWVPTHPVGGVSPLRGDGARSLTDLVLVLDGQQRIRALLDAFRPMPNKDGLVVGQVMCVMADGASDERPFWHGRRYGGEHQFASSTVPLAVFRRKINKDDPYWAGRLDYDYIKSKKDANGQDQKLHEQRSLDDIGKWHSKDSAAQFDGVVDKILKTKIAVRIIDCDEKTAMDNYRRLNEAGKPLLKEELGFAEILLRTRDVQPSDVLAASLAKWRDPDDQAPCNSGDDEDGKYILEQHDSNLARGDERHFGLKLLIRSVGIANDVYHGHRRETGNSLARLEPNSDKETEKFDMLVKHAGASMRAVAESLHRLNCDTRSRIPRTDATGVWAPLLALLIRFPELREPAAAPHVDAVVLGLFLAPRGVNAARYFELVVDSFTAREAVEALLLDLDDNIGLGPEPATTALQEAVSAVNTSFGRYVDLLYWLLRHRKAKDVPVKKETPIALLDLKSQATRQHIVPWSRYAGRTNRREKGWINGIGNITWISGEANGFIQGWGERPMVFHGGLEHEEQHFAKGFSEAMAGLREKADAQVQVDDKELCGMVGDRRKDIADAMLDWWRACRKAAGEAIWPETIAGPMERKHCLRDQLYKWWNDSKLADIAARAVEKTWYVEDTTAPVWNKHPEKYRTRMSWKHPNLPVDPVAYKLELLGPNEEPSEAKRYLVYAPGQITIPVLIKDLNESGVPAHEFKVGADNLAAIDALKVLLKGW